MKLESTWPSKHQDKVHLICYSCRHHLTFVHKRAIGNWEVLIFTDFIFGDVHSSTHFWWHWIKVALCTLYKNMDFFFPKENLSWMLKPRSWTLGWEDFYHQAWSAISSVWEQNYGGGWVGKGSKKNTNLIFFIVQRVVRKNDCKLIFF